MAISVGDKIPNVPFRVLGSSGMPETVNAHDVLGKGKVVVFAVPGAFTPGCSMVHLPGYVQNRDALKAKGVETIACVSVNDQGHGRVGQGPGRRWHRDARRQR